MVLNEFVQFIIFGTMNLKLKDLKELKSLENFKFSSDLLASRQRRFPGFAKIH